MSHAVADVRERLIQTAPLAPFEGEHRVFVVEHADALGEESQNAMLKTLEEPQAHAHFLLLADDSEAVLETVASRCQLVELDPLPEEDVIAAIGDGPGPETAVAAARLSRGDPARARFLVSERGSALRKAVESMLVATLEDGLGGSPWLAVLDSAEQTGEAAGARVQSEFDRETEEGIKHTKREVEEAVKRAARKARTGVLDLALLIASSWARDWSAAISGAGHLMFNADRIELISSQAEGLTLASATDAVGSIEQTRSSLSLNVSEELALEALCFRLERRLARP
jgi:DNA polymerase-3 subunit delta'